MGAFIRTWTAVKMNEMVPGSVSNFFPVIYAGDLARAYYRVFELKKEGVHRYILTNPKPVRMDEIYDLFCRKAGLKRSGHLPREHMITSCFFCELWALMIRSENPPLLTRARMCMFYDNVLLSEKKAEFELGFIADTPLDESIEKTVDWYRQQGFCKRCLMDWNRLFCLWKIRLWVVFFFLEKINKRELGSDIIFVFSGA